MPKLDPNYTVRYVETIDDILDLRSWISEKRDWLGVDTETSGLNLGRDKIRLCQFGDLKMGWAVDWENWRGVCQDLLSSYNGKMVFHNAPFDVAMFKANGIKIKSHLVHDTFLMARLIHSSRNAQLKPLAVKHIGPEAMMGKDDLTDLFRASGWGWPDVPTDHPSYWIYGAMDTSLTAGVAESMYPEIREKYSLIYDIEIGCVDILSSARVKGMAIDSDYITRQRAQYLSDMEGLRSRIPFAPSKDAELCEYFEHEGRKLGKGDTLGMWWPFRTDSNEISMDKDALTHFEKDFPTIIPYLREWRQKSKIVTSYFNNILSHQEGDVVHPDIQQVAARTGRMSIHAPALQTLPRGTAVRDAFVAREGHKLLLADYSQAEARVFAALAECQPMIDVFKSDVDFHSWVAAMCYTNGDISLVTKPQRQVAKNVGFAKLYGAGIPKIALTAGVAVDVIKEFMDIYNARFPEVERYSQGLIQTMWDRKHSEGEMYVMTTLGRKLIVDDSKPYACVNYTVQCEATSDLIKLKMCELDGVGLGDYIRIPIHDELITEVPEEDLRDAQRALEETMPEYNLYSVPLDVETDIVPRWSHHYGTPEQLAVAGDGPIT